MHLRHSYHSSSSFIYSSVYQYIINLELEGGKRFFLRTLSTEEYIVSAIQITITIT